MMLFKWLKKCYNRRQERMLRQLQSAQPTQMQVQPPAQPMQFQQLHVPALAPPIAKPAYRVHYRPASISKDQTAMEDSMKSTELNSDTAKRRTYNMNF